MMRQAAAVSFCNMGRGESGFSRRVLLEFTSASIRGVPILVSLIGVGLRFGVSGPRCFRQRGPRSFGKAKDGAVDDGLYVRRFCLCCGAHSRTTRKKSRWRMLRKKPNSRVRTGVTIAALARS